MLRLKAEQNVRKEFWEEAIIQFERVLQLDNTLVFALNGLEAAKQRLTSLLSSEATLISQVSKMGENMKGKFGRILGDFKTMNGDTITTKLMEEGHAVQRPNGHAACPVQSAPSTAAPGIDAERRQGIRGRWLPDCRAGTPHHVCNRARARLGENHR